MMARDSAKRREAAARDLETTGGRDARVEIVSYDSDWPRRFDAEAERLQRLVPDLVLHHVGSTAVPSLAAKPVIDMMALVDDPDALVGPIIEADYEYPRAYNAVLRGRRWFCRPSAAVRTHHLHLVAHRAELDRHLHFRDVLRQRPDLAEEYAVLKRRLAQESSEDRENYTAGKSTFVERIQALTL